MDMLHCIRALVVFLYPTFLLRLSRYVVHYNSQWIESLEKPWIMKFSPLFLLADITMLCLGASAYILDQAQNVLPWMRILFIAPIALVFMSNLCFAMYHNPCKAFMLRALAIPLFIANVLSLLNIDHFAAAMVLPTLFKSVVSTYLLYQHQSSSSRQCSGTPSRRKSKD